MFRDFFCVKGMDSLDKNGGLVQGGNKKVPGVRTGWWKVQCLWILWKIRI